jgi:hypothetical protein
MSYYITTPIIFHALERPRPDVAVYLVQREVAERMVAPPGDKTYGALSVNLQAVVDVALVRRVPPSAFNPPPTVESAVVRVTPRAVPSVEPELEATFRSFVLAAFGLRSIAMQGVYGPVEALAWLTPGAQGGLLVGTAILYGLETLSPRARATIALTLLAVGTLLVNLAPPDRYFEDALAGFSSGRLANLQGLLRLIALVWPLIALAWFWRRAGGHTGRSL